MTRGEKIAWIWVWSAVALVSIALTVAIARYWSLPFAYLNATLCNSYNQETAGPACARIIADEQAPAEMQANALRRLAAIASGVGNEDIAVKHLTALIQSGIATAEDWNLRGLSHFALRNYRKAAEDFQMAALIASTNGTYWRNLGDAQTELKEFSAADQSYTTAILKGYDIADVLGNRGWARYQLGSYNRALEDYDKAIAEDPQHADNLNERGLVRHALQDYAGAITDFDKSLKLLPDSAVILTSRAMSYARLGEWEKVRNDLDRAIVIAPKYAQARVEKAWFFIDRKQPESALSELAALANIASLDLSAFEAKAQAHTDLNQWEAAIVSANKAIELGSRTSWLYQLSANAKYELGDYEGAIVDATLALKIIPANTNALVTRALARQLSDQPEAALSDMDLALETASSDRAYVLEVRSYFNASWGRLNDALSDAQQSVTLAPNSVDSSVALGRVLSEKGDGAAALLECNRALTLQEVDFALRCRALAHLALQQPTEAIVDVKRALALNSTSSNNYYILGRAELALGNAASAINQFNESIRISSYDGAAVFMYRGDAERVLGNLAKARLDYQEANKRDLGRYRRELAERLTSLPTQ